MVARVDRPARRRRLRRSRSGRTPRRSRWWGVLLALAPSPCPCYAPELGACGGRRSARRPAAALALGVHVAGGFARWPSPRSLAAGRRPALARLEAVTRGLLVALPVVLILGVLLASADAAFAQTLSDLLVIDLSTALGPPH
ncbi:MAG: DUF4153 domain-containing protein [Dehalococcoidia bacterium]